MFKIGVFLLVAVIASSQALKAVESHLSDQDRKRLDQVYAEGLKSLDLQTIYYSTLRSAGGSEGKALCGKLNAIAGDSKINESEKNFYIIGIAKNLQCGAEVFNGAKDKITKSLAADAGSVQDLYFNYFGGKLTGAVTEATKTTVVSNLQNLLKKEDTLNSRGHALLLAADIGKPAEKLSTLIKETIEQADEVDGKMLQFEGGLSVSAMIFTGSVRFSKVLGKPLPVTDEQLHKFATYFLSRKSVQLAKGASFLVDALESFKDAKSEIPVCIELIGNGQIDPKSQEVLVKIVDIVGKPVGAIASVSASLTAKSGGSAAVSSIAMTKKGSDNSVFSIDLKPKKLSRGTYVVDIKAGTHTQKITINLLGTVSVSSLEFGIGDVDNTSAMKKQTITYPNKLNEVLKVDSQQKIQIRVSLVDENSKAISLHQVFVRFQQPSSPQKEIIFVAEPDTAKAYKFDIELDSQSNIFKDGTGLYKVELIVGDFDVSNSFLWHLADVSLSLGAVSTDTTGTQQSMYQPKQEIIHQFRVPEKRPPAVVSSFFTILCGFPLLLLFVFWAKLKVKFSIPTSLSALGFHIGLGAIFGLFTLFWLELNMFETIRYLLPLLVFTFIAGNRMLRAIASKKTD